MIKLLDFKKYNLLINWKLINIGCLGSKTFYKELEYQDIVDFIVSIFNEKDDNILRLLSYNKNEYDLMGEIIKEIAFKEDSSNDIAYRKWELIYVINNIPPKDIDCIQGIVGFYDIWSKLDFPIYMPFILQGVKNNITPEEYYTDENYLYLYNRHLEWIEENILFLRDKV